MRKDINGEVKISLNTLFDILESEDSSSKAKKRYNEAVTMFGEFLQFLRTKEYFRDIAEEFNGSHDRLSIKLNKDPNNPSEKRVVIYIDGNKINTNE